MNLLVVIAAIVVIFLFFAGIRIIRPTHRGLVEVFGKYRRFAEPGFHWILPAIARMFQVNTTEQMVDAEPQEIITNDNLNARVDAQVYFNVKADEDSVKASQYNVNNYEWQIVNLARTTLRNIIGTMTLKIGQQRALQDQRRAPHRPCSSRDQELGHRRSSAPSSRRSTRPRTSRRR